MGHSRISALICSNSALMAQGISVTIDALFNQVSNVCFTPHYENQRPSIAAFTLVIIDAGSSFSEDIIAELNHSNTNRTTIVIIGEPGCIKPSFPFHSIERDIDLRHFEEMIRRVISAKYDMRDRPADLTKMQEEVAHLIVQGLVNKEIARQLAISEATVRTHLTAIYRRLRVKNRTEAAVVAREYFIAHGH